MVLLIGGAYQGKRHTRKKNTACGPRIFSPAKRNCWTCPPAASGIWSASRLPASGRGKSLQTCWEGLI